MIGQLTKKVGNVFGKYKFKKKWGMVFLSLLPTMDGTERYDFWSRFLPNFTGGSQLGGKRKEEWSSKNRDQKSYLSVPSYYVYNIHTIITNLFFNRFSSMNICL